MWRYEKRLQYPVNITNPNPQMAQFIMSQYGGPYRWNRLSGFPHQPSFRLVFGPIPSLRELWVWVWFWFWFSSHFFHILIKI